MTAPKGHGAPDRPQRQVGAADPSHIRPLPRGGDPALFSARTLAGHYARGTLSPVEALEAILARIARLNPVLNAIVALDEAGARAAARASEARWRAGVPLSPLDGVALTVKDNIAVAGLPCTWGS